MSPACSMITAARCTVGASKTHGTPKYPAVSLAFRAPFGRGDIGHLALPSGSPAGPVLVVPGAPQVPELDAASTARACDNPCSLQRRMQNERPSVWHGRPQTNRSWIGYLGSGIGCGGLRCDTHCRTNQPTNQPAAHQHK